MISIFTPFWFLSAPLVQYKTSTRNECFFLFFCFFVPLDIFSFTDPPPPCLEGCKPRASPSQAIIESFPSQPWLTLLHVVGAIFDYFSLLLYCPSCLPISILEGCLGVSTRAFFRSMKSCLGNLR